MLGDGEPEPSPAVVPRGRRVGLLERLKQFSDLLLRHANPGIRDCEFDQVALVDQAHAQLDPPIFCKLSGVAQEIEQALA